MVIFHTKKFPTTFLQLISHDDHRHGHMTLFSSMVNKWLTYNESPIQSPLSKHRMAIRLRLMFSKMMQQVQTNLCISLLFIHNLRCSIQLIKIGKLDLKKHISILPKCLWDFLLPSYRQRLGTLCTDCVFYILLSIRTVN